MWDNLADFVNSFHVTHSNSNSTETYQDPLFNSSGPTALARGARGSHSSRPCHEKCEVLDGEEKELCLERCKAKTIVTIGMVLIFILGVGLGVYPFRFLVQRANKGIIEKINKKSKCQNNVLENNLSSE